MKKLTRRDFIQISAGLTASAWAGSALPASTGRKYAMQGEGTLVSFANLPDRIWLGAEFWANPMEDWAIRDGRLECGNAGGDRNVHLLTHQLSDRPEPFSIAVRTGVVEQGERGGTGFRIGKHDLVNDYRGNCLWGAGIDAGIANGRLVLGDATKALGGEVSLQDVLLEVEGRPAGNRYELTLKATNPATGAELGAITNTFEPDRLIGNVALVNNFSPRTENGSRFWYDQWHLAGEKFAIGADHTFGPILWAMYTLSNSRGPRGYEMNLTAQMPPLGREDSQEVEFQIERDGEWQSLGTERIHPDARTATFSATDWDPTADVPYRLLWTQRYTDGSKKEHERTGSIRKEPTGRPLVVAGMTCQHHMGFPYGPVAQNLAKVDPDLLFFSGDQIYEENGHYGITRFPAEAAILSYLRKWYMFGWVFGEVMRDRPTLCIPDDHDVFQGNIWGEGGEKMPRDAHVAGHGGYIEPVRMVEVVHRTNTAHHPAFYDTTPIKQDMSVYYGDMVYSRTSFAIIGDRQWKTGPDKTGREVSRPDWIPEDYDISTLDDPAFNLLGERQEEFLEHWVQDWRGADMKVLLSETIFANVATHHGRRDNFLKADLDSGGWPQSARNRAIRIARKGFPVHLNGDQHLASLVQYGVDDFRDSFWSLCTPAISAGYQRWWLPDEVGREGFDRPEHGLANTGKYLDGLDHPTYVYAVANPPGSADPNRYIRADIKASGFGIVRVDPEARTYTMEAYRFLADLENEPEKGQFPGWPLTIDQTDNYGRTRTGELPEVKAPEGVTDPVVKVFKQETGELVYALRIKGDRFRPFVFEEGRYVVEVGDPDADRWERIEDQSPTRRAG